MRYLVIDNHSGYVIGDTALDRAIYLVDDPIEIGRRLDQRGHVVPILGPHDQGYRIYRASNSIGAVIERRNPHMIEAIEQRCVLVVSIRIG